MGRGGEGLIVKMWVVLSAQEPQKRPIVRVWEGLQNQFLSFVPPLPAGRDWMTCAVSMTPRA